MLDADDGLFDTYDGTVNDATSYSECNTSHTGEDVTTTLSGSSGLIKMLGVC